MFILFLVLSIFSVPKTKYEKLMILLNQELKETKATNEVNQELKRLKQAIIITKSERYQIFLKRDKTYLKLKSYERLLKRRKKKIKNLVVIFYKLHRSTWGKPFFKKGGLSLPSDGRESLKKILERELSENRLISLDLEVIKYRLKQLNTGLKDIDDLVTTLIIKKKNLTTKFARVDFKLKALYIKRKKFSKSLFDAKTWELWSKITSIKTKYLNPNISFKSLKGTLLKPVPGTYLKNLSNIKGVYISTKANGFVRSPGKGTIKYIGKVQGYGNVIVIEHYDSYYSLIGRVDEIKIKLNEKVARGKILGTAAPLGNAAFSSIYYELRRGTDYLDPKLWLKRN
jgi:murein DD-endopeptidase MepM/ murein hydrolase activator NlpD